METDVAKKNAIYGQIDKLVMQQAVVYPGVQGKLLLMRSKNATNVFVNQNEGSGYDFLSMGHN